MAKPIRKQTAGDPQNRGFSRSFISPFQNNHMERYAPIAPSGRELSPQVTEGASGGEADGLILGWYLPVGIDTRL